MIKGNTVCCKMLKSGIKALAVIAISAMTSAQQCPQNQPLHSNSCQACFATYEQALSHGCDVSGEQIPNSWGCFEVSSPTSILGYYAPAMPIQNPDGYQCVAPFDNYRSGCRSANGDVYGRCGFKSDAVNAVQALLDLEQNLAIDIDDNLINHAEYIGHPPSINTEIAVEDAYTFFSIVFDPDTANTIINRLDMNRDSIITRSEAFPSSSDLTLSIVSYFKSEAEKNNLLAYIGLYLPDGAIDAYSGTISLELKERLLEYTRTWEPLD